ncbi:MAG: hypothetical protein BGO29_15425 [Bacteroidales bacterium 36-12]|nr:MAG: hypothetical protein BGO29_15425 [Bacteroidales bacterium 36-12]
MKTKQYCFFVIIFFFFNIQFIKTQKIEKSSKITKVSITIPQNKIAIDPMIYGQMLEDCNDKVIYGGIADMDGTERKHITEMLKPLNIPVVRWPAGTYIHEYHWENGIGPLDQRPAVKCYCWGGVDNHRFGTDEFLSWCKNVRTTPYINLNMGNQPPYGGSLGEALNWIEYVNGSKKTTYGKKRAENGHTEPYNVKYWCIGNENYGPWGRHTRESATEYSQKLNQWANAIRAVHPDLQLLAVGYTYGWNDTILTENGHLIDYLTQHYYINSKIRNKKIENPQNTTFAPALVEAHLKTIIDIVQQHNTRLGRTDNPVKLSIDEWNNRHSVFDNDTQKYLMTRHDDRRMTDIAVVAGMLNIFIRNSPLIAMGNYIFPVNGHGLIKTVGDTDAYKTSIYYVFQLYRELMQGYKADLSISGPGMTTDQINFALEFGLNEDIKDLKIDTPFLNFIDGSAVITADGTLNVALINRSPEQIQKVRLNVSEGYSIVKQWILSSPNIDDANKQDFRTKIVPKIKELKGKSSDVELLPCSLVILQFKTK